MRTLAPVLKGYEIIDAMKVALEQQTRLDYRLEGQRKQSFIDVFSMGGVVSAFDSLEKKYQDMLIEKFGDNPGKLTDIIWKLSSK